MAHVFESKVAKHRKVRGMSQSETIAESVNPLDVHRPAATDQQSMNPAVGYLRDPDLPTDVRDGQSFGQIAVRFRRSATSWAVLRLLMSPSVTQITRGLPFRLDQILGSRPLSLAILSLPRESHGAVPACVEAFAIVSWTHAMVKCEGRRKLRLREAGVGEVK